MIDTITQFIQGFSSAMSTTESTIDRLYAKLENIIRKTKKKIMSGIFQITFAVLSLTFLTASAIVFFNRFFSLDLVLFGFGLLFLYIAWMFSWVR